MSKKKNSLFSNPALKRKADAPETKQQFNLVTEKKAQPEQQAIFQAVTLSPKEATIIEKLLIEGWLPKKGSEESAAVDAQQIRAITAEIKSITNQGAYLVGERVAKVRGILKNYKSETFGRWLETVFGNKKTGHNYLSYFELWYSLPQKTIKEKFKQMPRRVAYMLASRSAELEEKMDFIDKCHDLNSSKMLYEIRRRFPVFQNQKQKKLHLLIELRDIVKKMRDYPGELSKNQQLELKDLRRRLGEVAMRHSSQPKSKKINLRGQGALPEQLKKGLSRVSKEGVRIVIQDGDLSAVLVPLEDLEILETSGKA